MDPAGVRKLFEQSLERRLLKKFSYIVGDGVWITLL
jgi:hypothetical protein